MATEETYVIKLQTPDLEPNDAGTGFVNGWKVTYRVTSGPANGTNGSVFVTNDQHNAAAVNALIRAKIKDLTEIASLGG